MKARKRISIFLCSLMAVLLLSSCTMSRRQSESEKFSNFVEQYFVDAMEGDYTRAHISMEEPEKFGVDESKITVNLGTRVDEASLRSLKEVTQQNLEQLQAFERDLLTPEQQDTYDILMYMLTLSHALNDEKFDYYQQFFESANGIHYQLPIRLAAWSLRDEQDVKDLITVVNDIHENSDMLATLLPDACRTNRT